MRLLRRLRHLPLAAAAAAGLAACAASRPGPPAATTGEAAVVRAARLAQNAALARGDLAAADSFWTDDVTVRTGLGRLVTGRDAYRAAFQSDTALRYERTPTEVVVSAHWPLAYERGAWAGRRADAGAGAPLLGGRYAAQWVKTGGRWRIRSEVFVALECSPPACDWPATSP